MRARWGYKREVRRAGRSPFVLALLGAALHAAAFPPADLPVLAFVAPVPLLLAVRRVGPGRAALLGWLYGTVGVTACVGPSLFEASGRYFDHSPCLRVTFALALPQLYGAPYFAIFAWAARRLLVGARGRALLALSVPAVWTACEFARASIGNGGPWLLMAHAQHAALPLLQIADVAGAYGVSFLVVSVSTALVLAIEAALGTISARALAPASVTPLLLAAALGYGWVQLAHWQRLAGEPVRVALVQGNLPATWRRSASQVSTSLQRLRELTEGLAAVRPDLVVWPENAVGFAVAANQSLFAGVAGAIGPAGRLLLGAPRAVERAPGRVEFRNSAFLLNAAGEVTTQYDKLRLTPFAEYAPWPSSVLARRRFARRDVYAPGETWTLFEVRDAPFATLICYEAIYPALARRFVREGATFLVNISNDDWFGTGAALTQHLHAALLSAVAHRRPLVRATNTGITAVVAPTGAVVARAPVGGPATLVAEVHPVRALSLYARVGDVFAWLCAAGAAVAVGVAAPRRVAGAGRAINRPPATGA
jgi:apolipoprotein N-acyltransferase